MLVLRRRLLLAAASAALALAAPASARADCGGADATPAEQGIPGAGQATLCLINEQRAAQGLPALSENAQLTKASQDYSDLMIAKGFFAHDTPDGVDLVTRLTTSGYLRDNLDEWAVGENLAWGQGGLATPRSIVSAWMGSPGHKANILSPKYAEIGLGIAVGTPSAGSDGATYTTDFGRRHVPAPRRSSEEDKTAADKAKAKAAKRRAARRKARARAKARAAHARARAARIRRAQLGTARHRARYRVRFISA